jgi:chromosome segregation ATPase
MPPADGLREELKAVLELTTRVDERIKMISSRQQDMGERLNRFVDEHNELSGRVPFFEDRLDSIEDLARRLMERVTLIDVRGSQLSATTATRVDALTDRIRQIEDRLDKNAAIAAGWWGTLGRIGQMIVHAVWVIIVCYLLWRLGLNPTPLP